jgi:hypothetical protein
VSAYLVFNHHSLPFTDRKQAKAALPDFLRICEKAIRLGKETILIDHGHDQHWFNLELAPGYTWKDWHDQAPSETQNPERLYDQIRAFRSIATRQPFFLESDIAAGADLYEVWHPDQTPAPAAFLAACWHDAPLLSFATQPQWQISPFSVIVRTLDMQGNLQETSSEITNIHSLSIIEGLSATWQAARDEAFRKGRDLWQHRSQRYPNLIFCGKSESQLCNWRQSETTFEQVKQVLDILDQFGRQWQTGLIADYSHDALRNLGLQHRVSGESESCAANSKRRRERTFYLPTGEKAYFENHVKLSNGQRMHFFPDKKTCSVHVGYIGTHLR